MKNSLGRPRSSAQLLQYFNELLASLANPYLFVYERISEVENFSHSLPTRDSHWTLNEKIGGKIEDLHKTPVWFYSAEAYTDVKQGLPRSGALAKEYKCVDGDLVSRLLSVLPLSKLPVLPEVKLNNR